MSAWTNTTARWRELTAEAERLDAERKKNTNPNEAKTESK